MKLIKHNAHESYLVIPLKISFRHRLRILFGSPLTVYAELRHNNAARLRQSGSWAVVGKEKKKKK